ncbi:MAG: thymidine phosphorylase [Pirellulales bacterium]
MNAADLIARKRDGQAHSAEEIEALVRGYTSGDVPDYQMSAWAMAVFWRGMNPEETVALTRAMLTSGKTLEASDTSRRVDKHSTGGIGDKTSFILAPLLACCGLAVPMISGRGLGATGGTLDKLESIPGARADLTRHETAEIVTRVGCVITGATADLVPADRKLYALRDVTSTVASIPLITASILSKKLAERLSALVLDVKYGSGAFMKTHARARALAESLVEVGTLSGVETTALVTSMNQPCGRMVGNAVEIDESLEVLGGAGPDDLRELTLALAGEVLAMKGLAKDAGAARATLVDHLKSGRAVARFREMIAAQGGDLDAPRPRAPLTTLTAERDGWLTAIDAERLGLAIVEMGGGRKKLGDKIDHSVGLEMLVRLGDRVERGQPLVHIFAGPAARASGQPLVKSALVIGDVAGHDEPLVSETIRATDIVTAERRRELVDAALAVSRHAHAVYSNFHVGAALLAESGRIYTGTNVENKSYGMTICAERTAFSAAIAAGEKRFKMLAIASPGGVTPCGACRQFAAEFCEELPVLLVDSANPSRVELAWLSALLPGRFEFQGRASDK